jgi:hypothetical protein
MGRLYYFAYLRPAGGLYDHAVTQSKYETGGIEMIGLDPAREDDPYDFGH